MVTGATHGDHVTEIGGEAAGRHNTATQPHLDTTATGAVLVEGHVTPAIGTGGVRVTQ